MGHSRAVPGAFGPLHFAQRYTAMNALAVDKQFATLYLQRDGPRTGTGAVKITGSKRGGLAWL